MSVRRLLQPTALAAGLLLAGGCGLIDFLEDLGPGDGDSGGPQLRPLVDTDLELQRLATCEDVRATVTAGFLAQFTRDPYLFGGGDVIALGAERSLAEDAALADDGAAGNSAQVPDDVSQTNVQEAGVDEADMVKAGADGTLYVLSGGTLTVVAAFPPAALTSVATLTIGPGAFDLYLDEERKRVVVVSQAHGQHAHGCRGCVEVRSDEGGGTSDEGGASEPGSVGDGGAAPVDAAPAAPYDAAELVFVDVSERSTPAITGRMRVEGWHVSSRRVDGRVHLVSRYRVPLPAALADDADFWPLVEELHAAYAEARWGAHGDHGDGVSVAEPAPVEDEPVATDDGQRDGNESDEGDADDETAVRGAGAPPLRPALHERAPRDPEVLRPIVARRIERAMAELDVRDLLPRGQAVDGSEARSSEPLGCGDVYAPGVDLDPGLLVVTSIDTDGQNPGAVAVLNNAWLTYASQEHLYVAQTSAGWWWPGGLASETAVYKFAIAADAPRYEAVGRVDGWLNDSFSLSEYEGFLRLATTENRPAAGDDDAWELVNHLFVLEDDGAGVLAVTGAVRDLAPDERIYGARFLGERGFVVTFRQIDPLFAFDLSDPRAPRLLGELELPGFSTYLHPLGDDHLLTVGRAGERDGTIGGVALRIFDVSDLSQPRLVHEYVPEVAVEGWSWSPAEHDHRAFLYYEPRGLLLIPLSVSDWQSDTYFNGIAAYAVDVSTGFNELGRVDHADLAYERYCTDVPADQDWIAEECARGQYVYGAAPERAVVMTQDDDTFLYSISRIGIKATPVAEPDDVLGTLTLPQGDYGWWWGWGY